MNDAQAIWSVLGAIGLLVLKELIAAVVLYFRSKNQAIMELQMTCRDLGKDVKTLTEKLDSVMRLKADVDYLFKAHRANGGPVPPQNQ